MTSRHASGGGRRGVAPWIIVTAVVAALVVAATTAYLLIVRGSDDQARASCTSSVVLPVVSSPGATAALKAAATAFDATAPAARSACVSTTVTSVPGGQAGQSLTDGWTRTQQSAAAPAVWVPDSDADLAAVETVDSGLTAGRDTSPLATSPVVIAVRSDDAAAVTAAGLSWQDLPAATGPDGTVTLPSGQHLVIALPNPATNRATSYALQSVLAARTGAAVDPAAVSAAVGDLATIGTGGPPAQPASTSDALAQLAKGTGEFNAVPVVESELTTFSATTPGLTAISPVGATVGDAVYAVGLTAPWVTPTLEDASALFLAYLRGPGGTAAFTGNGLRVAGSTAAASATTGDAASSASSGAATGGTGTSAAGLIGSTPLPDAGQQVADALGTAVGAAPAG